MEIMKFQYCAECGADLEMRYDLEKHIPFLQCRQDISHNGIARPMVYREYNTLTRREMMEQRHGKETALALMRYDAITSLDKQTSSEILEIMWPNAKEASPVEFARAIGLCVDYGADPRTNDLYLIPFKNKAKIDANGKIIEPEHTTFQCVKGISLTRKVACRKHNYSFLDATPRYMTEEEEKAKFKTVNPDMVRFIVKLRDMDTQKEGDGWGEWPKYRVWTDRSGKETKEDNFPKGGGLQDNAKNSMENMAAFRAERHCIDRMYPMDIPSKTIPYIDELEERETFKTTVTVEEKKPEILSTASKLEDKTTAELEQEIFGDKKQPGPGGEVPMSEAEKKKAVLDLRALIKDLATKLKDKKDAGGKPRYPVRDEIAKIVGKPVTKFDDIPDDKVSAVASHLDNLLQTDF
ncbi:MAG: hypothetical protein PHU23_00245 [Dehalococcoidales bacterium]|nr:hypothetical protein [Dehalococcoidales bacterium]